MSESNGNAPLLWTAKRAAKALAISERKLWSLTNIGDVPSVKIDRAVRYDPADLAAFITARKTGKVDTMGRRGKRVSG